jgi:hypothetical protein
MPGESTDMNVTLTRPNGETKTFGPMPVLDAAIVTAAAADRGVRATVTENVTVYLADGSTERFEGVTRERAAEIELTLGSSPNIMRIDVEPAS